MKKVQNILELIGETPMVRINKLASPEGAQLWAKVEYLNPGGSIKDRVAVKIIDDYEADGVLKAGGTIVEATSGNTGMGLAMVAAVRGYKAIFVMPDKVSDEKRRLLRGMGAEVVICPTAVEADDPRSYYSVAQRLSEKVPGAVLANQYYNPSNPQAHYDTTGPEIWEQTAGKIDAFVTSLGTGGTTTGTVRYLREQKPDLKVIAADPYGSILKTVKDTGKMVAGHPYLVEGIGEDIVPGNMDLDLVDEIINVNDEDAFLMSRRMAREEGLFAGGSAGAIMKVAVDVAASMDHNEVVVTIIPDTGERYLSKHFNDEWLHEKGMLASAGVTLSQLNGLKKDSLPAVISVQPEQQVREALGEMNQYNVSQLPVLDGNRNLGSLRENGILTGALKESDYLDRKVSDVMEAPYPSVEESASLAHSTQLLLEHQGLVLTRNGQISGFITRHDAIKLTDKR